MWSTCWYLGPEGAYEVDGSTFDHAAEQAKTDVRGPFESEAAAQAASPSPLTGTVAVTDGGLGLVEPVRGVARYTGATSRGDLLLFTTRTADWSDLPPAPYGYRFYAPRPNLDSGWLPLWGDVTRLREFVTGNPVGTSGKVSNRSLEVVDFMTAVPNGAIVVADGVGGEKWARP